MRKTFVLFLVASVMLFGVSKRVVAQKGRECPIQVLVTDVTGAKVPDAVVSNPAPSLSAHTNEESEATISRCEGGVLSVASPGFFRKSLQLPTPVPAEIAITLEVGSGGGLAGVPASTDALQPAPSQITSNIAPESSAAAQGTSASQLTSSGTTLALIGLTTQSVVSGDAIKAMPHQTITVKNGHTQADETYSGVPLIDLLQKVGAPTGKDVHGKALSEYVVATGADGYKAVLALAEAEPDFHPGQVLVADQVAGKPLDAKEGPFKLIVSEDKRPARSVHNLVKLELKSE